MASELDASSHRTIPFCFELCSILVSSWRVSGSWMFPQHQSCWLPTVSSPADVLLSTLLNDKPAFKAMISENRRRLTAASTFCREWFRKRGVHAFNTVAYVPCLSKQKTKFLLFFSGHFMLVDFQKHLNITTFNQEKELWQRLLDAGVYTVCFYIF